MSLGLSQPVFEFPETFITLGFEVGGDGLMKDIIELCYGRCGSQMHSSVSCESLCFMEIQYLIIQIHQWLQINDPEKWEIGCSTLCVCEHTHTVFKILWHSSEWETTMCLFDEMNSCQRKTFASPLHAAGCSSSLGVAAGRLSMYQGLINNRWFPVASQWVTLCLSIMHVSNLRKGRSEPDQSSFLHLF